MKDICLKDFFQKKMYFEQVLPDGKKVTGVTRPKIPARIPKIQRDYAQGRETESVRRKRKNLLTDMILVLYGHKQKLSFDFVYGYMMEDGKICSIKNCDDYIKHPNVVFAPLDGQQRLTTLFLFHWFFDRNDILIDSSKSHSLFIYETRPTSEEFCNWLVQQNACKLITSWRDLVEKVQQSNKENEAKWGDKDKPEYSINRLKYPKKNTPRLLDYITTLEDFKWDWHDDPNIRSMIVVIESIYNLITEMGKDYNVGVSKKENLDNITFQLLDDLECDGDELFEKMNARGKALTHFEVIKSTLEEELELQGIANDKVANDWRANIDNKWVDYYWSSTIACKTEEPTLKDVREVEARLETLILRMIAKSFLNKEIKGTAPQGNTESLSYHEILCKSITDDMDSVVDHYVDYALHERSLSKKPTQIDFNKVYNDIENILYRENGQPWKDIFQKAKDSGFNFYKNSSTLLDNFLTGKPTHNIRVMFYAALAYLEKQNATDIFADSVKLSNFIEWLRFVRNVYLAENKTAGLDNVNDANAAIRAIDNWLKNFFQEYNPQNGNEMLTFINTITPEGQEEGRIKEEKLKAGLRLQNEDWNDTILEAERNNYLWGQIIAPLSWSKDEKDYNIDKFKEYTKRLNEIFSDEIDWSEKDIRIIQAMLCIEDYRACKEGLGSLLRFNNHRDFSWKRYLRDEKNGVHGKLFKVLIDDWISNYSSNDFIPFLEQFIESKKGSISPYDWRYFVINVKPDSLLAFWRDTVRANTRHVYSSNNDGHTYYFRSSTMRTTIRYEVVTSYLHMKLNAEIQHVNGEGGAAAVFETDGKKIMVQPVAKGMYNVSCDGVIKENLCAVCLIKYLKAQFSKLNEVKNL